MSKETPENTQISSALQFKQAREARDKGDTLTLTSGLVVRLKRPDVTKVIAGGHIPSAMVQRFMDMQGKTQSGISAEDLQAVMTLQRALAEAALIEPKVVDDPVYENNEISLDDLQSSDLEDIWAYANGGLEGVDSFRKERESRLSAGPTSDEVSES